ncbi:MAG: PepSY domain-containing protein [Phormidesmis sp.]
MTTVQTAKRQLQKLKRLHSFVAPIVIIPIVLTLVTGSIYQAFDLMGKGDGVDWLLALHKGHFGPLNLEVVYPFLNALGLLFMAITGGSMWLELRRIRSRSNQAS